jgi:PAS domain S-box-containing protein
MSSSKSTDVLASETHFYRLYEEAPLPYLLLDGEGRLIKVNQACEDVFGYRREEVLGRYLGDFLLQGFENTLPHAVHEFASSGPISGIEFEVRCKDGTSKLVSMSGHIVRDNQGQYLYTYCILIDITDRKGIEKALQDSDEKYRLAMEASQDGLWDWDVNTGSVYYSPGWNSILGEKETQNNYSTWEDRIHPEDKPRVLKTLHSHLAGETTAWREEHRLKNADGEWIWVLGRGRVVKRDQRGKPLRMVGTMSDINHHKQAEKALHYSEERLKALINATSDDVVVLLDSSFRMEIVNERAAQRFCKTVEQLKGCSLGELMSPERAKERLEYAHKVINSGKSVRFEDYRAGRWYDNNMSPVLNDEGKPQAVAIFARDITERKRMERALADAKDAAERASATKTRFLAAASHDLRQPLQAISSYKDILTLNNTSPDLAGPIKQLGDAVLAMQELLECLLDVNKLNAAALKPYMRSFYLGHLLSQLKDQYQTTAMEKGLVLKFVPCNAVVHSDPTLLRVILQNLISNAIKYTQQGKVVIGCRRLGGQLRIEIRDTGIGIPEEEQESVFEEFYQLDNPARDRSQGLGIGLAIVKRMAELLKHTLSMHSVPGKGSCFAIRVPLDYRTQKETHVVNPVALKTDDVSTGSSILLVEDDEIVLHASYGLLQALGYTVKAASSAEAALRLILSETPAPDIIITDYRLPGDCDGAELVQQLRAKTGSPIPAIVLTGDTTIADTSNYLPDNSLLLEKPARVEELVLAINQLLGNPAPAAE